MTSNKFFGARGLMKWALFIICLFVAQGVIACPQEDCVLAASSGSNTAPQVVTLEEMTVPYIEMDFDEMPLGSTSVAAIQAAFPGSVLENISVAVYDGEAAEYNFQVLSGRALGAIDFEGTLGIISPDAGVFQSFSQMTVSFSEPISEFGFGIGDWVGPFTASVYRDGLLIASEDFDTFTTETTNGPGSVHYIQEATGFNQVVLSPPEDFRLIANWVVPFLAIPYASASVPAIGPKGVVILVMLMMVVVTVISRGHRVG